MIQGDKKQGISPQKGLAQRQAGGLIFDRPKCGACGALSRYVRQKTRRCQNGHLFTHKQR